MKKVFTKKWLKAAGVRAVKTTCQTLGSTIPVGLTVTPVMIQHADWTVVYVVLAWLGTGLLAGASVFLTSLGGLPEVDGGDMTIDTFEELTDGKGEDVEQ